VNTFQPGVRDVHVVPNAADPEFFRPDLARPSDVPREYVLFFGAFAPWQGLDLATTAAADPAWPSSIELVVIGGGQEAHIAEEAQSAMPDRVRYLGSRSYSELPAYVANALVTLVPKRYHASAAGQSPLKLYESLAAGVPVIATRLAGATDIEDLGRAVTAVASEPSAIARAVETVAADRSAAKSAGRAGRQAVLRRHTWDHRAEIVLELLARPSDQ
jgi:glycosyltransferase involved in cell wall biosynthesis